MNSEGPIGKRWYKRAESTLKDSGEVLKLMDAVRDKFLRHQNILTQVKHIVEDYVLLLAAWSKGQYRDVPWTSLLSIGAALIYFINPIDVIPDFLFGGFIDDIGVLTWVSTHVADDVRKFRQWKQKQRPSSDDTGDQKSQEG